VEKRAVLAFGLSIALLVAYLWVMQTYFEPPARPTPAPTADAPTAPESRPPAPAPTGPGPGERLPRAVTPRGPEGPRPPQKTAVVEASLYRGVVSSEGGKLQEWTLRYRGEKPMVVVGEQGPLGLLVGLDAASAQVLPMTLSPESLGLGPARKAADLVLAGEAAGLRIRQTLRFHDDQYFVDVQLRVENPTNAARSVTLVLPWLYRHEEKAPLEKFPGQRPYEVMWLTKHGVERIESLTAVVPKEVEGGWIAIGSISYLAALIPGSPGFTLTMASETLKDAAKNGEYRVTIGARAAPSVGPGQAWEGRLVLYIGPKEYDRLEALGLEGTVNFGGFPIPRQYGGLPMEWIGVPILKLMNWLHRYIPNYGIVIILLTLVSKVLFYPLTVKSVRSMKAMQSLQPQVNSLRAKYKNDPRKLQEETLALYRRQGVNPMGGCLPMVAQVPIFYALYLALSVAVELQNAPFLCFGRLFGVDLWICDLASHDPTYVLPILMGISMFVQQKMTPTMGDPRQARMMLFLPFIFTFMFLNLPSGLVLYWFVSNVLQILQQWWMDRPRGQRAVKETARG
jgi:YidC/Oxa1 family membrane protein insertase